MRTLAALLLHVYRKCRGRDRRQSRPRRTKAPLARRFPGGKGLYVSRGQRFAAAPPTAALDLLDDGPGDGAHVFALDGHHRVREFLDDFALLRLCEYTFNDFHLNQWHKYPSAN